MSMSKLLAVFALAIMVTALAAVGAGWKWQKPHGSSVHQQHLAGWTWDERVLRHH
jgi:hypothetical protein